MKTRISLVSNSSSTSFIVRGIKVDIKDLCNLIGMTKIEDGDKSSSISKFISDKFQCRLDVIGMRNYFNFDAKYEDVILGLHSQAKLKDGEIVKVGPDDVIDVKVIEELKKIGYPDPQLATWVQYVSNDNC